MPAGNMQPPQDRLLALSRVSSSGSSTSSRSSSPRGRNRRGGWRGGLFAVVVGCALLALVSGHERLRSAPKERPRGRELLLESPQVPSLFERPAFEPKKARMSVLVDPRCTRLRVDDWTAGLELQCMQYLHRNCSHMFAESACWHAAIRHDELCTFIFHPQSCHLTGKCATYSLGYQNVWRRVLPQLKRMGWRDLHHSPELEQISDADVVVGPAKDIMSEQRLLALLNPGAGYVLMDPASSYSSTINGRVADSPEGQALIESKRVAAVLRHADLVPSKRQNGPLLGSHAHLAEIKGARGSLQHRNWTDEALGKVKALVPRIWEYRWPYDCGGRPEYVRFAGFFHPSLAYTLFSPPLANRTIDVAVFVGGSINGGSACAACSGGNVTEALAALRAHEEAAVAAVRALGQPPQGEPAPGQPKQALRVYVGDASTCKAEYGECLRVMAWSKVVVSPLGWGEWTALDLEATMLGAVVAKPTSAVRGSRPYPDISPHMLHVSDDWSDLGSRVQLVLEWLDSWQNEIARLQGLLREFSDPRRVAADYNVALESALMQSPPPQVEAPAAAQGEAVTQA